MAHIYSCGCIGSSQEPNCTRHGRQFVIEGVDYWDGKKRRTIKKDREIYLCPSPNDLPYMPVLTDLVIVERLDGVQDSLSEFFGSHIFCLILEGITYDPKKSLKEELRLTLSRPASYHQFSCTDIYETEANGVVYEYNTQTAFGTKIKLPKFEYAHRGVGCHFEKYVISMLKPKRIIHLNARTVRWMKAAIESDILYIGQTVNPLAYRLLGDNLMLDRIMLSDIGNLYGKK